MEQLLEDYKRRLVTAKSMANNPLICKEVFWQLRTQIRCYRTFIAELEEAIREEKEGK